MASPVYSNRPQKVNLFEDGGAYRTGGTLFFSDADAGELHTVSLSAFDALGSLPSAGGYGVFAIASFSDNASGRSGLVNWSYQSDNALLQTLARGQVVTETYPVYITDAAGNQAVQNVTITLTGVNDAVVITSAATLATLVEDGALTSVSGQVRFNDVDLADVHTASYSGTARYGLFRLGAFSDTQRSTGGEAVAGSQAWTYMADPTKVQALASGQTVTETFSIQVTDHQGSTATSLVKVNLLGRNDDVVITSGTQRGSVVEDASFANTARGSVLFSDADLTDRHDAAVTLKSGSADLGTFTLDPLIDTTAGRGGVQGWRFSLSDANANFLARGEAGTVVYTITVNDRHGSVKSQDVSIVVTGTNDSVVLTTPDSALTAQVVEDGKPTSVSSTIAFSDADVRDVHTASLRSSAAYGGFSLGAVREAVEGAGPSAHKEGAVVWAYQLDAKRSQGLGEGESVLETFTVSVSDRQGSTASQSGMVRVLGSNDAVVLVGAGSATISTASVGGSPAVLTGEVIFTDVDVHDVHHAAVLEPQGQYGRLSLTDFTDSIEGTTGRQAWVYTLDAARAARLPLGEVALDHFVIEVADEHGSAVRQNITVEVVGTNSAPTALDEAVSVVEDGLDAQGIRVGLAIQSGRLTFSDADSGERLTLSGQGSADEQTVDSKADGALHLAGRYGDLDIDARGVYTYALDNARVDFLALNASARDTFRFTVTDSAGASVTRSIDVSIAGSNDAPVAQPQVHVRDALVEDAQGRAFGNLLEGASDVDLGHRLTTLAGTLNGTHGTLVIQADGSYDYALDNARPATQALGENQPGIETFSYTVTDEFGASASSTLRLSVQGRNDPVNLAPSEVNVPDVLLTFEDTFFSQNPNLANMSVAVGSTYADQGIVFSDNVSFLLDSDRGGRGNISHLPSPSTAILPETAGEFSFNASRGFTDHLSFHYGAILNPATLKIYSGVNGSGDLLKTVDLPITPMGEPTSRLPGDPLYANENGAYSLVPFSVQFTGTAHSAVFDAGPQFVLDDLSLGQPRQPAIEPVLEDDVPLVHAALKGALVVTDLDVGDTLTTMVGPAVVRLNGAEVTLPDSLAHLLSPEAFTVASAPVRSTGGAQTLAYAYDPGTQPLDFLAEGDRLTVTHTVTVSDGLTQSKQDVSVVFVGQNDAVTLTRDVTPATTPVVVDGEAVEIPVGAGFTPLGHTYDDVGVFFGAEAATVNHHTPIGNGVFSSNVIFLSTDAQLSRSSVDVPEGFSGELSFDFYAPNPITVSIYEGLNGTGRLLLQQESLVSYLSSFGYILPPNRFTGLFSGEARSVVFTGLLSSSDYDNFTFGHAVSTPSDELRYTEESFVSSQFLVTGSLTVRDLDVGDTLHFSVGEQPLVQLTNAAGEIADKVPAFDRGALVDANVFSLNKAFDTSTGGDLSVFYTFAPRGVYLDFLREGEKLSLTFQVTADDYKRDSGDVILSGSESSQNVTVTIDGTNDAVRLLKQYYYSTGLDAAHPDYQATEAVNASTQVLVPFHGAVAVLDPDVGDTLTYASSLGSVMLDGRPFALPTAAAPLIGGDAFHVDVTSSTSNGGVLSLPFTYAPAAVDLDFLREGQTLDLAFNLSVTDGLTSAETQVFVRVVGTNDAPVARDVSRSASGRNLLLPATQTGSLSPAATDADDAVSTLVWKLASDQSNQTQYGMVTLGADGQFTYVPSALKLLSYNNLFSPNYHDRVDDIHYSVTDSHGASSEAFLRIDVSAYVLPI